MMATLPDAWREVSVARFPAAELIALAPLRDRSDVRIHLEGEVAWVHWPINRPEVVRRLLPVPGVEFLTLRGGLWFPFGSLLPTANAPPEGEALTVAGVLVPAPITPVAPEATP